MHWRLTLKKADDITTLKAKTLKATQPDKPDSCHLPREILLLRNMVSKPCPLCCTSENNDASPLLPATNRCLWQLPSPLNPDTPTHTNPTCQTLTWLGEQPPQVLDYRPDCPGDCEHSCCCGCLSCCCHHTHHHHHQHHQQQRQQAPAAQ
jgi:hypothetical protein